jgi:hypothetical protein
MGAAGVKRGDIGGGTTETSRMPDSTGVTSRMCEPTGIVEDHAEVAESTECHLEWLRPLELLRLLK